MPENKTGQESSPWPFTWMPWLSVNNLFCRLHRSADHRCRHGHSRSHRPPPKAPVSVVAAANPCLLQSRSPRDVTRHSSARHRRIILKNPSNVDLLLVTCHTTTSPVRIDTSIKVLRRRLAPLSPHLFQRSIHRRAWYVRSSRITGQRCANTMTHL